MTINRDKSVVIDYDTDASTDMFQLGRSMDSIIDFIVFDMIPNPSRTAEPVRSNSTVSRYACRIVCERDPPYTARLYAAGFDPQHQIVLSVSCNNSRLWSSPHCICIRLGASTEMDSEIGQYDRCLDDQWSYVIATAGRIRRVVGTGFVARGFRRRRRVPNEKESSR